MKKLTARINDLPEELMAEILARLPADSPLQCKPEKKVMAFSNCKPQIRSCLTTEPDTGTVVAFLCASSSPML